MSNLQGSIIGKYRIYTSVLYSNWFAVEFFEQRGGKLFRVRLPYNTHMRAVQMLNHLSNHVGPALIPDYRPHVHLMKKGIVR